MGDTGNVPVWDLNPAMMVVAFLCFVVVVVVFLAFIGGRK